MSILWPGTSFNGRTCSVKYGSASVTVTGDLAQDLGSSDPGAGGWGFEGPDDRVYGIASALSYNSALNASSFTLSRNYAGSSVGAAAVSLTIASPCVITWTAHALQAGEPVKFSTTGALPTGLTAGTTYYVSTAGLAADSFRVADTAAHGIAGTNTVNTSGSQSGVHTASTVPATGRFDMLPFQGLSAAAAYQLSKLVAAAVAVTASTNQVQTLLDKLSAVTAGGGYVGVLGDSIAYGYFSTSNTNAWFPLLQRALQTPAAAQGSQPLQTMMNLDGGSKYGLVVRDGSNGIVDAATLTRLAVGPMGDCPRLPSGYSWQFSGDYDNIDCYYQQGSASTTGDILLQKFSGSWSTLKTITAAASPSVELCSETNPSTDADAPTATGAGGSDTLYRILASGGTATITGIIRRKANTSPTPRFGMFAYPGTSTSHWVGNATVDSIINQMNRAKTTVRYPGAILIALGTNDIYNGGSYTTAAAYQANLATIFRKFQKYGIYVIAIGVYRCSPDTPAIGGGAFFEHYEAAQRRACEQCGVPLIALNGIDWVNAGLLPDGVHPGDSGHIKYYQAVSDGIAALDEMRRKFYTGWTPLFAFAGSTTGFVYSTNEGQLWYDEHGLCHIRARIIATTIPSRSDPLAVTITGLPVSAFGTPQYDFNVITSTGVTVSTGPLGASMNGSAVISLGIRTADGKFTPLTSSEFPAAGVNTADIYMSGSFFDDTNNLAAP